MGWVWNSSLNINDDHQLKRIMLRSLDLDYI